jgi:hypothetical protein
MGRFFMCVAQATGISVARTLMQLITTAGQTCKILEIGITFDGVLNSDKPLDIQALVQTTAGTSSGGTVTDLDQTSPATAKTTTLVGFSSTEPTASTPVFHRWFVHPQSGLIYVFQPGKEIVVPISTRLGIRIVSTPTTSLDVNIYVIFEEA